jgi:thiol-disulfide isomerase/thioredoxin
LQTIQEIIENNSIDEARVALNKFKNDAVDTSLVNFVNKKYMLPGDTSKYSKDLKLLSGSSESLNYNELIDRYKGKVIYVDFWSSGCLPCIKLFEFSERLKVLYKGQEFVQIYISIEPDIDRWKKACVKYDLLTNSYLVENIFSSRQLEEMNIHYVPHYYLYNKKGSLVMDFAPRPSDKKLIKLIDKYLSE